MYYKKIKSGDTIIEFHNNWLGVETIIVNGQVVSKKSSIMGTDHPFTVMEDGHTIGYVLITKVSQNMEVLIDLKKNGVMEQEDVKVPFGGRPRTPKNPAKKRGVVLLNKYDIDEAIVELNKALKVNAHDPETWFHLACAHSIVEDTKEGFECLKKAVAYHLPDTEEIFNHDMLAFLRMHEAFEAFHQSNFSQYDEALLVTTQTRKKDSKDYPYDFDNKRFTIVQNSANGKADAQTQFRFSQEGDLVTAEYFGGDIRSGKIIAKLIGNQLDMRYQCITSSGELKSGKAMADISVDDRGKIRLHLDWEWLDGDGSGGRSEYVEQ